MGAGTVAGAAALILDQQFAAELFLSEATVKTYVSRLLTKLDVRDRVQPTVRADETGLVRPRQNLDKTV